MKKIIIVSLTLIVSCSSDIVSSKKSMLQNRDCNPDSARFSGKDYVQQNKQVNSVAFDHCTKSDTQTTSITAEKIINSNINGAIIHKCEVEVNGSNYAVSNKNLQSAKSKVLQKCQDQEHSDECFKVNCIAL